MVVLFIILMGSCGVCSKNKDKDLSDDNIVTSVTSPLMSKQRDPSGHDDVFSNDDGYMEDYHDGYMEDYHDEESTSCCYCRLVYSYVKFTVLLHTSNAAPHSLAQVNCKCFENCCKHGESSQSHVNEWY